MSELLCPRDKKLLRAITEFTYYCDCCGGTLIDVAKSPNDDLKRIPSLVNNSHDSGLVCPTSGEPMQAIMLQGVEVDYCSSSSMVWLDRGEIESIRKKVKELGAKKVQSSGTGEGVISTVVDVVDVVDVVSDNIIIEGVTAVFSGIVSVIDF